MDTNNICDVLTPNKIQSLLRIAEDRSYNKTPKRIISQELNQNKMPFQQSESSSGILDVDNLPDLDKCSLVSASLFNAGEITGRSTESCDVAQDVGFEGYGRHSLTLESIASHMEKQTQEVSEVMRHSIAASFSSKYNGDLTADEINLMKEKFNAPLDETTANEMVKDLPQGIVDLQESFSSNMSAREMYFKAKCPNFSSILPNTDSPDRFMRPSISEVSSHNILQPKPNNNTYDLDHLDSIPVRQPKPTIPPKRNEIFSYQTELSGISEMSSYFKPGPSQNVSMVMKQGQKKVTKPTDVLLKNLQTSFKLPSEDTEASMENSLSISRIADVLNRQSNVTVADILKLNQKKQPLHELQMNALDPKQKNQLYVTQLKDTKRMNTASTCSSVNTVVSLDSLKIAEERKLLEKDSLKVPEGSNIPDIIVIEDSADAESDKHTFKTPMSRSKTPSSKSPSTLTTVQENRSFQSSTSPLQSSKGESVNTSHIPSPNVIYKELDKSVDWHEVLQQKRYNEERLAKGWIDVITMPAVGYIGTSVPVTFKITTNMEKWLTAKIEFDVTKFSKDIIIELPRQPFLISHGKIEQIVLHVTSNIEIKQSIPFTISLKDVSKDASSTYNDVLDVDFKIPYVQAVSTDGLNKVLFHPIRENSTILKYFVLVSDCNVDLQLELSIAMGDSFFVIKNVQEIKKSEMREAIMDAGSEQGKANASRQLCRLSEGNAVKVTLMFKAPKLADLKIKDHMAKFNGVLNVNLLGVNTLLEKVDLVGTVGTPQLEVRGVDKVFVNSVPTSVTVQNTGIVPGVWMVKFKSNTETVPFRVSPGRFDLRPDASKDLTILYTGPSDVYNEGFLVFEEVTSSAAKIIFISGGSDRSKIFPIKTNSLNLSWVKAGKKELSLKNATDKKIQIRCQIIGEGFSIDTAEQRVTYIMSFGPFECRPLTIVFSPNNNLPHAASLHLVYDKNSDVSRKVKLHGCASGDPVRWSGLVTYGDTALVRVVSPPVDLTLYNRAPVPAFVYATLHFNLQYRCLATDSVLSGARRVVPGRSRHTISLAVDWRRLERRARTARTSALATLTVLTGPEHTRRRVIKILKDEGNGQSDTSLLPENLRVLVEQFEGEDTTLDKYLEDFTETKACLNELLEGFHELTAQIDIPQDATDDNTILISDETVLEHHTLCE